MSILRQSTAVTVRVGSFVDATDGVTPETGVTLGAADQAEAMKAGGGASVDISGRTWIAVTGADGWYDLSLIAGDVDTVGDVTVVIQDASLCLPVLVRFQVVEEAVYDILYASGATGATTLTAAGLTAVENEVLDAALSGHTTGGTVGAFLNLLDDIESDTSTILTNITLAGIADAVWDEATAGHVAGGSFGALLGTNLNATVSSRAVPGDQMNLVDGAITSAKFAAGAITSTVIAANAIGATQIAAAAITSAKFAASAITSTVLAAGAITSAKFGSGAITSTVLAADSIGASQLAANAIGSSELASTAVDKIVDQAWDEVLSGHLTGGTTGAALNSILAFGAPPTAAAIADQVWDELIAGHAGAGSTGEALAAAAAGGAGLTQQQVRDALKLAPTAGAPAAGSTDADLDSIISTLAGLNDLSVADVQSALTAQGYTSGRAPNLDNLDVASSTLATAAALAALNDLSQADVQAALTAQGLTTVRAALLDNLDAAISTLPTAAEIETEVLDALLSGHVGAGSVGEALGLISTLATAASVAALNDLSQADVQSALTAQGYTVARAGNLDNLDVASSTLATAAALAAAATEQTTVRKIMTNRIHVDPGTGVLTIFDDDDSSTLLTANIWSNVGGSVAYSGTAAIARRDKLA